MGDNVENGKRLNRSNTYSRLEVQVIRKCLDVVQENVKKREAEGLSSVTFFCGVMNTILMAFVFAGYPEHFWILYAFEVLVMFPWRFVRMTSTKPLSCLLYWLDFCWIANFFGQLLLVIFFADGVLREYALVPYSKDTICSFLAQFGLTRKVIFSFIWGVACGPLLGATIALGNALVFHNVDQLVGCLIHYAPPLVLYVLRWQTDTLKAAHPRLFQIDYLDTIKWTEIVGSASVFYFIWNMLYMTWLCTVGMNLPRSRKLDTLFHDMMRKDGGIQALVNKTLGVKADVAKQQAATNQFSRLQALVYLTYHAIVTNIGILVSVPCFFSKAFMELILLLALCSMVWNGANRYRFQMTTAFEKAVKKELDAATETAAQSKPAKSD